MYVTNLLRRFLLLGFSFSLIAVQRERGDLKLQIMQYSDAIERYLEEIVKVENQLIVLQEDSAEYDRLLLAKEKLLIELAIERSLKNIVKSEYKIQKIEQEIKQKEYLFVLNNPDQNPMLAEIFVNHINHLKKAIQYLYNIINENRKNLQLLRKNLIDVQSVILNYLDESEKEKR